jgi:hypothetical protein
MKVMDGEMCVARAQTRVSALYVMDRKDLEGENSDRESVRVVLSVPSGQRGHVDISPKTGTHCTVVFETANVSVFFLQLRCG